MTWQKYDYFSYFCALYHNGSIMRKLALLIMIMVAGVAFAANPVSVKSPDGQLELKFEVKDGVPYYALDRNGKPVVLPSKMGFTLE